MAGLNTNLQWSGSKSW